jgi:hypothetical protein
MSATHGKMRSIVVLSLLLCSLGYTIRAVADDTTDYAIVVRADQTIGTADAALIRLLYLKILNEWPSGLPAKPIGPPDPSPENKILLDQLLRMDGARLAQHWISLKQRTGQRRVRAVGSTAQALLLVKNRPGAFAIVPASVVEVDPDFTILFRFE